MSERIDRRSFLGRGAALGAGVVVAGSAGGLLAVCSSSSSGSTGSGTVSHPDGISSATPKVGGSLIFGTEAEEQGFSTTMGTFDTTGILYARTVYDPLMIIDGTGTPQPYLAQSVTPNADYTVWTITLRPNLVFHNGSTCDGAAVAENFALHKASALTGPAITNIVSADATGPLTCTVTMKSPWVPFNYYLTGGIGGQFAFIAEPNWLKSGSQTNPIGTGPFVFQEWIPNDHFTATRNPHYWRPNMPYLDSITFKPIIDESQRLQSLRSGAIDMLHSANHEVVGPLRQDKSFAYVDDSTHIAGEPDMDCLLLNLSKPPFENKKVRQAAAMAVSSAEYVAVVDQHVGIAANGPFPKASPYWLADNGYPAPDVARATQLVKEVQQETGKPVTVALNQTPDASTTLIAQYIQSQLQAVGMQVTLHPIQQAELIQTALLGNFQAQTWRQFGCVQPDLNYIFWSPTQINSVYSINMARNTDPEMETALIKGRQATTTAEQVAAYQEVNRRMGADIPYIWTGQTIWCAGAKPTVQNFDNPTTPAGRKAFGFITGAVWPTQIWLS